MSPECGAIFAKLSEYLDGELPADLCEEMREHIEDCAPCVEFVESLRRSVALCKSAPVGSPGALSASLREELLRAYLKGRY